MDSIVYIHRWWNYQYPDSVTQLLSLAVCTAYCSTLLCTSQALPCVMAAITHFIVIMVWTGVILQPVQKLICHIMHVKIMLRT